MPNKYYTLSCCGQETTQPQYSCHTCYPKQFELEIEAESFDSRTEIQEKLKSCYENYCKICEGTPLSYDEWLHADVSYDVYDDLPF